MKAMSFSDGLSGNSMSILTLTGDQNQKKFSPLHSRSLLTSVNVPV